MAHLRTLHSTVTVALLLALAPACDRSSRDDTSAAPKSSTATPELAARNDNPASPAQTQPLPPTAIAPTPDVPAVRTSIDVSTLDDAHLGAVMQSLHQRITREAEVAQSDAKSAEVTSFAHEMMLLHTNVVGMNQTLFQRLNLVPQGSPASQEIDADTANAIHALQGVRGNTFDADYLDWQSRGMNEAVQVFDRMLPVARRPELRAEISRDRTEMASNLQVVTRLQQKLSVGVTNQQAPNPRAPSTPMTP